MKRRGAVLLFAVVAAVGLCLGPAGAIGVRGGDVLVVNDDLDGDGCHGRTAEYNTIQSAIRAANPGDTIWVCPGRYEETVTVTKEHLTIKGANAGRDATRPDRHRESIVTSNDPTGTVQLLEDDITWDGFEIRDNTAGPGMYTSPQHSGYFVADTIFRDNGMGLHLGADGAHQVTGGCPAVRRT
jgi:hypothetical protein